MPNHIYLLWEQLKMNSKELPKSSHGKYTAKLLVTKMKADNDPSLKNYVVIARDRQHNIWLRYPLTIKILSLEILSQKLDYLHLNPMQPHWLLCNHPAEHRFSSAIFYEEQVEEFGIIKYFGEVF
jgi:putative transposase